MDFAARKGVKHEKYAYRVQGQWYVCHTGPKYTNVYRVTECDADGLALLERIEDKRFTGQRSAPDTTADTNPSA